VIAEFERALMSKRTMDGLAAARARGRTGGQKPKLGPRQVALVAAMYAELGKDGTRRYTVAQIAAEFDGREFTLVKPIANAAAFDWSSARRPTGRGLHDGQGDAAET
jgi:DNA invertase Pin-like site-specific DNA recombinase